MNGLLRDEISACLRAVLLDLGKQDQMLTMALGRVLRRSENTLGTP